MSIYKKPTETASTIPSFLSIFFAVFLAGFILLLITRWYIRETAKDINEGVKMYQKMKFEHLKNHTPQNQMDSDK